MMYLTCMCVPFYFHAQAVRLSAFADIQAEECSIVALRLLQMRQGLGERMKVEPRLQGFSVRRRAVIKLTIICKFHGFSPRLSRSWA